MPGRGVALAGRRRATDAIQRLSGQPQGAAARRTKTGWATATTRRRAGLFCQWPTGGRAPEWRVSPQPHATERCGALPARCQTVARRPDALPPTRRSSLWPPPAAALRDAEALLDTPRNDDRRPVFAAGQRGVLAHCGDSRLYLVRRQTRRARATTSTELRETLAQVVPIGERFNHQRALHLPRQPGQAGGRCRRPVAAAARRPHPAVLRRPVGHVSDTDVQQLAERTISGRRA